MLLGAAAGARVLFEKSLEIVAPASESTKGERECASNANASEPPLQ